MTNPNIVFLTVGCSNSTVCVRMLESLGWNLGEVLPEFAEHKGVHRVSLEAVRFSRRFDPVAAATELASIPKPWVVKQPLFCETLQHWQSLMTPYAPVLLWVTKNHDYVRASFYRRFKMSPALATRRLQQCQGHYDDWPFAKLKIDVAQLTAAWRLFNPERCFGFLPKENVPCLAT